jgi:subtilase family serine protease
VLLGVAAASLLLGGPLHGAHDTVALSDNHSEAALALAAEGDAPRGRVLRMEAYLAPRHRARLERLLEEQQDPGSPEYHRWLSAAEWEARFGPTAADVAEVTRWLTAGGFRVTFASAREGRIAFESRVATAENAFRVRIAGSRDGRWFANLSDPQVPAHLAPLISHIAGLDNLSATRMHTLLAPPNNNGLDTAHFGPPDVWTYYDERALLDAGSDGRGQCIAALEGSDVDDASLANFDTVFALPPLTLGQNYDKVFPDGPPGIQPPGQHGAQAYSEALVDLEYAHGLAPGAEIVLYAGDFPSLGTQGLVDTLRAATADNRCAVITISWAQCGQPKSFFRMLDDSYARGAAQGQSIFVATGDVGVAGPTLFNRRTGGCDVPKKPTIEENAGSPNVTAIGATQIGIPTDPPVRPDYDTAGNDVGVGTPPEQVWFYDIQHFLKGASTGGLSKVFKRPKFQRGVVKGKKRGVPDICLGGGTFSFPGFWECLDFGLYNTGIATGSTCTVGGGTSVAAPQWAAVIAILVQKLGTRAGNINPKLYALAKANLANLAAVGIRDVTVGHNSYSPLTGFNAGPGYDLASGWGSIDVGAFVNAFLQN